MSTAVSAFMLKPRIIEAVPAHREKIITYRKDGTAIFRKDGKAIEIPRDQQFDLTQATIFGLNERLTSSATSPITGRGGMTLRDEFNKEWEVYTRALTQARRHILDYGVYAYYAERNHLVRYCPPYWHRVVAVASSSKLITDPDGTLFWKEIQDILRSTTIAVAGGSVGNNIFHSLIQDLRPDNIKIADKGVYKMENMNRVRLQYSDIVAPNSRRTNPMETLLKNKAITAAAQAYAIDPYINVFSYSDGVSAENAETFFGGDRGTGEPPADMVIEEVDDPRMKLYIREESRRRGLPVIMATDVGSAVQIDIFRYDLDRKLPLSHEIPDTDLYKIMQEVYKNSTDRRIFFRFVDALIGRTYRQDELQEIIEGRSEIPTATMIPQLGSTSAMAGAIVAETAARIRLGHRYPKRAIMNKKKFTSVILIP